MRVRTVLDAYQPLIILKDEGKVSTDELMTLTRQKAKV